MQDLTPIEKALELFTDYRYALSLRGAPLQNAKDTIALQCAIIACQHAKANLCSECDKYADISYWENVIQELKKLPT